MNKKNSYTRLGYCLYALLSIITINLTSALHSNYQECIANIDPYDQFHEISQKITELKSALKNTLRLNVKKKHAIKTEIKQLEQQLAKIIDAETHCESLYPH